MTLGFPKASPIMAACPKTLQSIAASVGGLAMFLIFASLLLVSQPIGSTVWGYFYGFDHSRSLGSLSVINEAIKDFHRSGSTTTDRRVSKTSVASPSDNGDDKQGDAIDKILPLESQDRANSYHSLEEVNASSSIPSLASEIKDIHQTVQVSNSSLEGVSLSISPLSNTKEDAKEGKMMEVESISSEIPSSTTQTDPVDTGCNLYEGKWVYNPAGPLYTNNSCPVLTQMQNCQGNGRPDKEYENWRWQPAQCDLPRFDAKKFLELMRGKTLAYIGDSVARNQMESMLCILWQVEVPRNRGNRRMQRYYFKSTSMTVVRIWSSWLVRRTTEKVNFAPKEIDKLHLDLPDETLMEFIPNFDVIILSSGHWFAKQSVYMLNNEIVGGQLWWPDKSKTMKINNIEAFGVSVETILTAIGTHPSYSGLTIVRSYSPDHYEGGAWNTGGSCTGKTKPAADRELVENGFTKIMHDKQVQGYEYAAAKKTNKSKMRLMDITRAFEYRRDGHPGPYRSPDPNKITKRGPDGRPPPQDCLHWCMPGPVDTWNEMVFEIVRREFERD